MDKISFIEGRKNIHSSRALSAAFLCAVCLSAGSMADPQESQLYRDACDREVPREVLHQVRTQYAGWVIQSPNMLGSFTRKRWEGAPHSACPGTANGQFGGQEGLAFALLIVHNSSAQLVLYRRNVSSLDYSFWLSKKLSGNPSNFYIQGMPVNKVFDRAARRRFRAIGRDFVLVVDAGDNEYEADAYFWTGKRFASEPIDY